jgi:hypothetical protein
MTDDIRDKLRAEGGACARIASILERDRPATIQMFTDALFQLLAAKDEAVRERDKWEKRARDVGGTYMSNLWDRYDGEKGADGGPVALSSTRNEAAAGRSHDLQGGDHQ